jgi:hypothetical protein
MVAKRDGHPARDASSPMNPGRILRSTVLGTALLAGVLAQANIDPRYNVTCVPGTMVISLNATSNAPGVAFLCQSSRFTRSYERRNLKEDAVASELGGFSLVGYVLWFLGEYSDDANTVRRYQDKVEDLIADARSYVAKGDEAAAKTQKAKNSADRKKFQQQANDYYDKSVAKKKEATKYVQKIRDLVADLGADAPRSTQAFLVTQKG